MSSSCVIGASRCTRKSLKRGFAALVCFRSSPVREPAASPADTGHSRSEPPASHMSEAMMAVSRDSAQPSVEADLHVCVQQQCSKRCASDMSSIGAAAAAMMPEQKTASISALEEEVVKCYGALVNAADCQTAFQPYMCPSAQQVMQHWAADSRQVSMPCSALEPASTAQPASGTSLTESSVAASSLLTKLMDADADADDLDSDSFWDASSQLSIIEPSGGDLQGADILSSYSTRFCQHGMMQACDTESSHTTESSALLRMDMLPHLPAFITDLRVPPVMCGPQNPLPFLDPGVIWQPVPAVTGLHGCWLKVPERSSPSPLPIDVMLHANWLARKAHDGVRGVQITEDHQAVTVTAKAVIMGAPIHHKEVYYKDGRVYRGMLRRDLKPGYVEHRAFWTACGKLVLVVECYSLSGRLEHGGVEVVKCIDGGEMLHFAQARYSYLTKKAAMQHFVGTHSQRL